MATEKKSLKELLTDKFAGIKEDVTREMKYKVALQLNISERTIDRYLSGTIYNVTLGTSIFNALNKEVKQAARALHAAG